MIPSTQAWFAVGAEGMRGSCIAFPQEHDATDPRRILVEMVKQARSHAK